MHRFLRLSHRPRRIEHAQLDSSFIWTLAIVLVSCVCLVSCGVTVKMIAHRRSVKLKLREYGIIVGDSTMSIHPDVKEINRRKIEQGNKVLRDNYLGDVDERSKRGSRNGSRNGSRAGSRNGSRRRVSSARRHRRRSFDYGDNAIDNLAIIDHTRLHSKKPRPSSKYNRDEISSRGSRRSARPSKRNRLPPIHKANNYFDTGGGFP